MYQDAQPATADFVPEKTYFVDDTILRYDPTAPERLSKGNRVIVPLFILRRIEADSNASHEEAILARQVSQHLATYEVPEMFSVGVKTRSGGVILVTRENISNSNKPKNYSTRDDDTMIINEALAWQQTHPTETVVFISRNLYMRLTARARGLASEDYRHDRIASLDPGVAEIELVDESTVDIFNLINRKPACTVDADIVFRVAQKTFDLIPNQFCRISRRSSKKDKEEEIFCMFKAGGKQTFDLVEEYGITNARKVIPRNLEQRLLYKALLDPEVRIVAAGGPAGTGKTLFAVQAGYELYHKNAFDQILVYRPHNVVGEPEGFLPGTYEQKIEPWKTPIIRSLGKVCPIIDGARGNDAVRINGILVSKAVQNLLDEGFVQILGTSFIQGDTFERSFIIVDEAQNMKSEDMKTLLTRIGKDSKFVITGDMGQVHNPKIKQLVSGLVDAIECLNGSEVFSYVRLHKSERDPVVQLIIDRYNL